MTGVSIVIPTWNGLELLKRFLPSVIAAASHYNEKSQAPTEIVIVDDGSVDATVEWLLGQGFVEGATGRGREGEGKGKGEGARGRLGEGETGRRSEGAALKFVRNETNRGFGDACNRGVEAASHQLVFLLNNDVEPAKDSIAPLVENFNDDSVFATHCRVIDLESGRECGTGKVGSFARGFIRVHRSYVPRVETPVSRAALCSMFAGGGSAMFHRRKFLEIGGFESLLSPFYWEDVELSYRAWKRGYSIVYEPRSLARHRVSSTISRLNQRAVRTIEQRNRLIYHWIHLHDWRLLASHALWVLSLALTAPLRLKPEFISSCIAALKLLPEIRKRRAEEKRAAQRSDREVFHIFASLEKCEDVFAYDDSAELEMSGQSISKEPGS